MNSKKRQSGIPITLESYKFGDAIYSNSDICISMPTLVFIFTLVNQLLKYKMLNTLNHRA